MDQVCRSEFEKLYEKYIAKKCISDEGNFLHEKTKDISVNDTTKDSDGIPRKEIISTSIDVPVEKNPFKNKSRSRSLKLEKKKCTEPDSLMDNNLKNKKVKIEVSTTVNKAPSRRQYVNSIISSDKKDILSQDVISQPKFEFRNPYLRRCWKSWCYKVGLSIIDAPWSYRQHENTLLEHVEWYNSFRQCRKCYIYWDFISRRKLTKQQMRTRSRLLVARSRYDSVPNTLTKLQKYHNLNSITNVLHKRNKEKFGHFTKKEFNAKKDINQTSQNSKVVSSRKKSLSPSATILGKQEKKNCSSPSQFDARMLFCATDQNEKITFNDLVIFSTATENSNVWTSPVLPPPSFLE